MSSTRQTTGRGRPSLTFTAIIALVFSYGLVQAQPMTDEGVSMVVEREFLRDDAVPFSRIDVVTMNGIVTLTGRVASIGARRYAERRASTVRGVRGIVNRIEVRPTDQAPAEVADAVRAALRNDPATDEYEVNVVVDGRGRVVLTGSVDSLAEMDLVDSVAATVRGVAALDNQLEVGPATPFVDESELADQIKGRLRWDVRVNDSLIDVLALEGGRVLLSGTVGSLAEKNLAEQLAHVRGVRSVEAMDLEVAPWAEDDDLRRGKYEPKSDQQVREALMTALSYDPRVLQSPIDIDVDDGTVWLRGSVDHLMAKRAAERDVRNTVGVNRVFNHLKVRPEILSDATISELLIDSLRGQGLLEDNEISVAVDDRRATLSGDVDTTNEYWRADRAATSVPGIEEMRNDLTIRGREPTLAADPQGLYPSVVSLAHRPAVDYSLSTDREIYDSVRSELVWSPFVDADSVTIDVDDGVVTLTGTVGSIREQNAARDNAFEGGATMVHNELAVAN